MLVGDLAREFVKRQIPVGVEGLNRSFCNALTSTDPVGAAKALKGKRTDIFVGERLAPSAIIEVKIRISRYSGLAADLRKIRDTIDHMKPSRQRHIFGVSVFQIHLKSNSRHKNINDLVNAVRTFERRLTQDLELHNHRYPGYSFSLKDLMASVTDGIVDQAIEEDFDGKPMLGNTGHATRYYAVLMTHALHGSKGPSNFEELKAESRGLNT